MSTIFTMPDNVAQAKKYKIKLKKIAKEWFQIKKNFTTIPVDKMLLSDEVILTFIYHKSYQEF